MGLELDLNLMRKQGMLTYLVEDHKLGVYVCATIA